MCGIIGYTGTKNAVPKIMGGLKQLEYRGYDSAGIALSDGAGVRVIKGCGRVKALEEKLGDAEGNTAIGHTRWATHGSPSDENAHPHRVGSIVLVHNGIIENDRELKEGLAQRYTFESETDTEVACALIDSYYKETGKAEEALRLVKEKLKGSYAFAVMVQGEEEVVYALRKGSPLLLAKGEDGFYLASDITAFSSVVKRTGSALEYYLLEEGAIAVLTREGVLVDGGDVPWMQMEMKADVAQKGMAEHYMLKEMLEQPEAIRRAVLPRIKDGLPDLSAEGIRGDTLRRIRKLRIVGCGSATHAALMSVHFFSRLAGCCAEVSTASEYRYYPPGDEVGTLVVLISQSGETADTLAALRDAKARGLGTLAVVNAPHSSIAREADLVLYTNAGPEIAVATTKGYCTQVALLEVLALSIGLAKGTLEEGEAAVVVRELLQDAPSAMEQVLEQRSLLGQIAESIKGHGHIFFIGRGTDYAMAQEGALKLKEISYIHAEAYAAGELKHGTISLIEEGTPVVALITDEKTAAKTESNVREVKSRGAYVISIASAGKESPSADVCFALPPSSHTGGIFASLAAVQMLAYETALRRGCDVDKPRNLAKSVTVE